MDETIGLGALMPGYNAIIIGTGQAGRRAAVGMQAAIVERKLIGGTCVNGGCTPNRTLIASAHAARSDSWALSFDPEKFFFPGNRGHLSWRRQRQRA